jgi:hypothetical protein
LRQTPFGIVIGAAGHEQGTPQVVKFLQGTTHANAARPKGSEDERRDTMSDLWLAILYVHLLAMAFFVGGQLLLAVAVLPVARRAGELGQLRAIARRFGWGTLIAIVVLIATGGAIATHDHLWANGKLHLKLALVALVCGLVVWHLRRPSMHLLEAAIFVVSLVIVWLGLSIAQG